MVRGLREDMPFTLQIHICKKKPLPADWVFMNSCSKKLDPKTNLFSDQNRLYNWSRFENQDLKIKEYNWSRFENQRIQLVCVREQNLNSTQVKF